MIKKQFLIGWIILVLSLIFAYVMNCINGSLALYTLTGLCVGYVMQRSRLGFAGVIKKMYVMGNADLSKAIIYMLIISLLVEAGMQYYAHVHGVAFSAMPGTKSVKTVNLLTLIGGILFGAGMMFSGGCASGTLTDVGEGYIRALITLLFFCLGSVVGVASLDGFKGTFFSSGFKYYFPDHFGYFWSLIIFLAIYGAIYLYIRSYEAKRKSLGTYKKEEWEDWEKPQDAENSSTFKIFSYDTYHTLFVKRWSFYAGGSLLAIFFLIIVSTTNSNWGVTTEFTYWGGWIVRAVGINIDGIGFYQTKASVMDGGFFHNGPSLRNAGIIVGTIISGLLAGGFKVAKKMCMVNITLYIIGGAFMGFGARLASGCNIGAFYSSLSSMSLSGIVFAIALLIGGLAGLTIRKKLQLMNP